MNHIHWKNLFCVAVLSIYLLTAPVAGQKPASQPTSRPARVKITISRKTTYVLGPLNADGTVNYVAAINKMCSKGVTPKNNAAIPLLKALGPEVLDKKFRSRILKALKMPPLPEKGDYFISFWKYQEHHEPKEGTDEQIDAFYKKTDANWDKAQAAPFSPKDFPFVAKWLKVNEKPLAMVAIATARPRHYILSSSSSKPPCMFDTSIPDFRRYREAARALCARSMLKADSGDIAAARADLMVVHRLARLVRQGPTLVDRLVAMSIEAFACSGGTSLATSGKLSAAQAKAHLSDLLALPPLPGVTEPIDKAERFYVLDMTMLVARKGMPGLTTAINAEAGEKVGNLPDQYLQLDWDLILVRINKWHDYLSASVRKPSFPERKRAAAVFERDMEKLKIRIAGKMGSAKKMKQWERKMKSLSGKPTAAQREASETMADSLVSILVPLLSRASEIYDRVVMQRRMAQVALALAACKGDIGRYPVILAVLKPHYLKKIPNDLFIEKPLHYKRTGEGYLLYSVGPNMKDDGGKERGDGKDCDDIVVKTKCDTETQRHRGR